jgi:peptidoglycan-N-acetylmuramic acid deacetylase
LLDYKKLLKALKDNDVKTTFFVTGYNLKNNPDYIKLLLEEGHTVANHTITHKDFTTLSDEAVKKEFSDFESLYRGITGLEPVKMFRFPYGTFSKHLLNLVSDMGYTSFFWSTAMKDWEPRKNGADDAYNDIINNLHDGNIILMHHASKENIDAMDRILKQIKSEGYELAQIAELMNK